MKNKGFTLIELLAVLTILAIISLITVPIVVKTINSSKQSTYDIQKRQIERAAENWFIKQNILLTSERTCVALQTLLDQGYLEQKKITNTKTGEPLTGCVTITYQSNQYEYEFSEEACSCTDNE